MSGPIRAPDGLTKEELERWVDGQIADRKSKGLATPPPGAEKPRVAPENQNLLDGIGCMTEFKMPDTTSAPCRGGCGVALAPPGVCSACIAKIHSVEIETYFTPAMNSVPEEFRWVRQAGAELAERCPVRMSDGTINPRAIAWRASADLMTGKLLLLSVSIPAAEEHGKTSRTGKSVFAARLFYSVIQRAITTAAKSWPPPIPEPHELSIARRARWMQAVSLTARARVKTEVDPFDRAEHASILVLDDVGQEDAEGFAGGERRAAIRELLTLRWTRGRPTVITHPLSEERFATAYGGGVHGRLFDDERSARIEVGHA